jgi:uncharacterized protein (DUF2236 family)
MGDDAGTVGDLGLFGPGSVSWRLYAEPILLVGGLRALYLQALHPVAVAGVAQNSDFKGDPWGRLRRTSDFIATVVYGTSEQARAAGRRVQAIHRRMRGINPVTGEFFRIDDPELLRWVHVTEVESFLTTAVRAGLDLGPEEIDRYYDEQRRCAELVGLDPASVPGSAAEVERYYEDIRPHLRLTRDSADAALFLIAPPLPGRLGFTPVRLAYTGIAALAIGLLPPWARRRYGLPGLPATDLTARLSARALRMALAAIPPGKRMSPQRRDALERARATRTAAGTG